VVDADRKVAIVDLRRDAVRLRLDVPNPQAVSWSPTGPLLAVAPSNNDNEIHVFDTEKGQRTLKLQQGKNYYAMGVKAVAWSPDGQRLVTGQLDGRVVVWNVPAGLKLVSAHLHTASVDTLAWSPDGRRVASGAADGTVRIWDPTQGEELLRLDTPEGAVTRLLWSRDGRRLAAACAEGSIYVWDASAGYDFINSEADYTEQVRHQLKQAAELQAAGRREEALALYERTLQTSKSKLGPDHPETLGTMTKFADAYDVAGELVEAITLRQQTLEKQTAKLGSGHPETLGTMTKLADAYVRVGRSQEAFALWRQVLEKCSTNPVNSQRNLAWVLSTWVQATWPDPKLRDPKEALVYANKAVELSDPPGRVDLQEGALWNTLGAARYRTQDWQGAVEALRKSMALRNGGDSSDWFFLAMAHWRMDRQEEARKWYDQAVQWMQKNRPTDEELIRFRAEAADLLGIKGPLPGNGKEVSPR
jgi:tetratricopeptide (TPR) repeat protein